MITEKDINRLAYVACRALDVPTVSTHMEAVMVALSRELRSCLLDKPEAVEAPEGMDDILAEQSEVNVLRPGEKWRLFPKKAPGEVDRDPVYREASRQLKPLRDAMFSTPADTDAAQSGESGFKAERT